MGEGQVTREGCSDARTFLDLQHEVALAKRLAKDADRERNEWLARVLSMDLAGAVEGAIRDACAREEIILEEDEIGYLVEEITLAVSDGVKEALTRPGADQRNTLAAQLGALAPKEEG